MNSKDVPAVRGSMGRGGEKKIAENSSSISNRVSVSIGKEKNSLAKKLIGKAVPHADSDEVDE